MSATVSVSGTAGPRRLRVGIIDLVSRKPASGIKSRVLKPNYASIMAQAVGVWAERLGHRVQYLTYTGFEDLERERPRDVDVVFLSAFTQAAYLAYALASLYRREGVVTVLGGPHARAYAADACRCFDYVVGLADNELIGDLLRDCAPHRPEGVLLSTARQPAEIPGVRERWPFIGHNLRKAPSWARVVPMIGSLGCPHRCGFCIDSRVPYQPLPYEQLQEDLEFLAKTVARPIVAWHDPNFGVRFDEYMALIEQAAPAGTFRFAAESTLSQLTEPHLVQLRRNGFAILVVGIESWFDFSQKAGAGKQYGQDKVTEVAFRANLVTRYVPHLQANLMFGIDADSGPAPFELTKRFIDVAPAVVPAYSLWTSFGDSAELDCQLQQEGRVLPVPFPLLAHCTTNVIARHYTYAQLLEHMVDLTAYSFRPRAVVRRFSASTGPLLSVVRWVQLVRSKAALGRGRYQHYSQMLQRLAGDADLRAFFAGQTQRLPAYFRQRVQRELGRYYEALPDWILRQLDGDGAPEPVR